MKGDEKPAAPQSNATIPTTDRQPVCQARMLSFREDGYYQRQGAARTSGKAHHQSAATQQQGFDITRQKETRHLST